MKRGDLPGRRRDNALPQLNPMIQLPMLAHLFRALQHPQFRLFYLGQLISITGTWMQTMAQAWLVYRLTGSSMMLGLVSFVGLLPVLLFGLVGGVLADSIPRRTLLIAAQVIAIAQALLLALLVLTGWVEPWHIVVLAFLLGLVHAVEMPSRHSFLAELVPAQDLPNAIALNSGVFNLARFIGPAIAGWLVSIAGEGPVFLFNGLTFVPVLLALITLSAGRTPAQPRRSHGSHLMEGLRYAWDTAPVRSALLLLAISSITAPTYAVLMPVFAHQVFGGGARLLGLLLGAAGAGALFAALRLAYLSGRQALSRNITSAAIAAGIGMIAFGLNDQVAFAFLLLALLGFAISTLAASTNTLLQMQVPNALRGRIMALFAVLFIGLTSLGNLMAGTLAEFIGARATVMVAGSVCLLVGIGYWLRARREPDTIRQG